MDKSKVILARKMVTALSRRCSSCKSIPDFLELAFSFQFKDYNIVPIQIKNEIQLLLEILSKNRPKTLLEIGTSNGGSLFLFCKVADPNATIISIDLLGGDFGGGLYPDWKIPFYKTFANNKQKLHLIRANSHDSKTLVQTKKILKKKKLDFLLIDGDHTYEGIKNDFEMYSPLVKDGGIICFHDINQGEKSNVGGVPEFWKEIKTKYESADIVDSFSNSGYGIGLIFYQKNIKKTNKTSILETMRFLKEKQLELTQNDYTNYKNQLSKNPLGVLLSFFQQRSDLQKKFPEVLEGDFTNLIAWAISICENKREGEKETRKSLFKFLDIFKNYQLEKQKILEDKQQLVSLQGIIEKTTQEKNKIRVEFDKEKKQLVEKTTQEKNKIRVEFDKEKKQLVEKTTQEKNKIRVELNHLKNQHQNAN